jgi:exodeoxyribonuclease VII large subunit
MSPGEIEAALACLKSSSSLVDVIVLARGGGSLEDLAPFNSERVARAIVASRLPVVSAIGHETDFTIADFVADLRAPTPSAAAELITEAQHKIAEHLATMSNRLERAARFQLLQARQRLTRVPASRTESRMATMLHRLEQRLDDLTFRLEAAVTQRVRRGQRQVAELTANVLRHDPRQQLAHARSHFDSYRTRLDRTLERLLDSSRGRLNSIDGRLHSLSPLAVLDRGYALVIDAQGLVVRSATQIKSGDSVLTRLSDGSFASKVESATLNNPDTK